MAFLDAVQKRLAALIAGTYPATPGPGDRAVPAGTFTVGRVFLPAQNPEWPKIALTRQYDLVFSPPTFDRASPLAVNTRDPVWYRELAVDVRIQYAIERPTALAPRDRELVLSALTTATLRASGDSMLLERVLLWRENWSGVALGARLRIAPTAGEVDTLHVGLVFPLLLTLSQDATTSPGVEA